MDIESSTNPPYYLPNKNVGNNNKFFQQGGNLQQGRLGNMNQSQTVSGNFSNLSIGNNLSLSQMNTPNVYGQSNRPNQGYNQPIPQQQQQNPFYNNYSQPNYNQQNFNQNNYPQQGKNPNMSNFNNTFQNQNYSNNGNFTNRNLTPCYQLP